MGNRRDFLTLSAAGLAAAAAQTAQAAENTVKAAAPQPFGMPRDMTL